MIEILKKLFGEKPKLKGRYALIDFTEPASELCIGGSDQKQLVLFNKHQNPISFRPPLESEKKDLERKGIPVLDLTKGKTIPEQCEKEPKPSILLEL